ncbi:MAG: hypothetical protein Q8Q33_10210 [Chlamydiota bacterium]|nr:hypothetical protein [Chlamydiota bacterium]
MTKNQFKTIINSLWKNRQKLINETANAEIDIFDFPDYGGLPNRIVNALSPEAVDAMQYIWNNFLELDIYLNPMKGFKTKNEFSRAYMKKLDELGEFNK